MAVGTLTLLPVIGEGGAYLRHQLSKLLGGDVNERHRFNCISVTG
jgi:hypothetical protein